MRNNRTYADIRAIRNDLAAKVPHLEGRHGLLDDICAEMLGEQPDLFKAVVVTDETAHADITALFSGNQALMAPVGVWLCSKKGPLFQDMGQLHKYIHSVVNGSMDEAILTPLLAQVKMQAKLPEKHVSYATMEAMIKWADDTGNATLQKETRDQIKALIIDYYAATIATGECAWMHEPIGKRFPLFESYLTTAERYEEIGAALSQKFITHSWAVTEGPEFQLYATTHPSDEQLNTAFRLYHVANDKLHDHCEHVLKTRIGNVIFNKYHGNPNKNGLAIWYDLHTRFPNFARLSETKKRNIFNAFTSLKAGLPEGPIPVLTCVGAAAAAAAPLP